MIVIFLKHFLSCEISFTFLKYMSTRSSRHSRTRIMSLVTIYQSLFVLQKHDEIYSVARPTRGKRVTNISLTAYNIMINDTTRMNEGTLYPTTVLSTTVIL